MNCPVCHLPAIPHGQGYWLCRVEGHMPTQAQMFAVNFAREVAAGRYCEPVRGGWEPGNKELDDPHFRYQEKCLERNK